MAQGPTLLQEVNTPRARSTLWVLSRVPLGRRQSAYRCQRSSRVALHVLRRGEGRKGDNEKSWRALSELERAEAQGCRGRHAGEQGC